MRILMTAIILTILVWFVSTPALGSHCPYHAADTVAAGLNLSNQVLVIHDMSGKFAEQFMAKYNAAPAPTTWVADHVLIFSRPSSNWAILALYHEDCLFLQVRYPLHYLEGLLPPPFASIRETSNDSE